MKAFFSHLACGLVLMLVCSTSLQGEVRVTKNFDDQDGLTLFKMIVTVAAEPTPALKHRLCLRPHEYKPGNAATYYLRASAENDLNNAWKSVRSEFGDAIDVGYDIEIPLSELPLGDLRKASSVFDHVVSKFVEPASCRRDCDWGYHFAELRGSDVYTLPLPGAQQSRAISRMLALRTRLATAEGRYEDAIDHMRMNYRLARNVGSEPIFVCGLVGMAEQATTNMVVLELVAAPGSPNLYWALSELPRPLVDMREAISLEMSMVSRVFPILLDAETAEHSAAEWARLISREMETADSLGSNLSDSLGNPELVRGLTATGLALASYPGAKQRLIRSGMDSDRVEQMPVGKVLAIDTAREYQRLSDTSEKWWYLPYPVARHRMDEAEHELSSGVSLQSGFAPLLANLLMPAVKAARNAQERLGWQMNALRVIEAIRMHAAETGELPNFLEEIQVVPVPLNPVTTEPYVYHLEGETAVLELPFSDGIHGQSWRFEITLADLSRSQ